MWKRLFFDRSKFHPQMAEYASWPLWRKCAAFLGVSVGAVSVLLRPYLVGKLTLGSTSLGYSKTIIPSDEPILFIIVVVVIEALFALMFYGLIKVFFYKKLPRPE